MQNKDAQLESQLQSLRQLQMEAPTSLLLRLHRRVQMAQVGRDLITREAWSFWIVLDTFLRRFFADKPNRNSGVSGR